MNVDCMDLHAYDPTVYQQMVSFPAEVMTIMDSEAQKLARQFQTEEDLMEDDEGGLGGLAVLVRPQGESRAPWQITAAMLLGLISRHGHWKLLATRLGTHQGQSSTL